MKSVFLAFLLAVSALGESAPASSPTAPQEDPGTKKARALIQQAIEALGGQAYLNVQDMEQEGRAYRFYHGEAEGAGTLFWRFWKWPDKDRVEVTKQRDIVYINNGDQGYEITYKGTAREEASQPEEYNRRRPYSLEIVLRQWLNQPGTILLYEGPAVAERKPTES